MQLQSCTNKRKTGFCRCIQRLLRLNGRQHQSSDCTAADVQGQCGHHVRAKRLVYSRYVNVWRGGRGKLCPPDLIFRPSASHFYDKKIEGRCHLKMTRRARAGKLDFNDITGFLAASRLRLQTGGKCIFAELCGYAGFEDG